ncbi:MAG: 3-phosphoshikimate 1-carboxyvinyltransferase [Candidatus Thiodiazotropha sp.]
MNTKYHVKPLIPRLDYGLIKVPGSKSITNRAICLAAFANGTSKLSDILISDDSINCIESIKSLGVKAKLNPEEKQIIIQGQGKNIVDHARCYVGSAGTAARFLTAMLSMLPGQYTLDASEQMRKRPMAELLSLLCDGGIELEYLEKKNHMPFIKKAGTLKKHTFTLDCNKSSQFLSGMLMASALSEVDVELVVKDKLVAKSYVDITLYVLEKFNILVENYDYKKFIVRGNQTLKPCNLIIEPDVSSASYFFSIPAILGGKICLENIFFDSIQGDIKFLDVLTMMGCVVEESSKGVVVSHDGSPLKGGDIDMNDFSDQSITAAVLAVFASSPVTIKNIGHVKYQESNRINSCIKELTKLGIKVEDLGEGIRVFPGKINGAEIDTHEDHRVSMSFSLLGLKYDDVVILDHLCCEKTFPNYYKVLESLQET